MREIHFGKVVNGGGRANKGSHPKLSPDESPGWKSSLVRKSDLDRRVLANKLFCHQPTESCKKFQIEISILLHQGTNHQKWKKPDKSNQYAGGYFCTFLCLCLCLFLCHRGPKKCETEKPTDGESFGVIGVA